jgi:hypothetical protein
MINIILLILHNSSIFDKPIVPKHLKYIIQQLSKFGKKYNYFLSSHIS